MTSQERGTGALVFIGAVLVFVVFVAAGIAFVGGDTDPEATGNQGGDENATREVPVATESPADRPYEYKLNETMRPDVSDLNTTEVERLILEETNEVRGNRSLGTVKFSESLSVPARRHSANMSDTFYLGHVAPDGEAVEERYVDECAALRQGREEFRYSENVANVWYKTVFDSETTNGSVLLVTEEGVAEALVAEWMNSSLHRQNLLGEDWRTMGAGVRVDENGTVFGTQAFCTAG